MLERASKLQQQQSWQVQLNTIIHTHRAHPSMNCIDLLDMTVTTLLSISIRVGRIVFVDSS